jgi:predicted ATP-dependent endonuclease of OLD family
VVFLEKANEALKLEFTRAWGQTQLTVKLDIDANLLKLMMSMQARDYIRIDQHSDGLRQFVALRAFLAAQERDRDLVVLIDEAETHLHYDAQADLVGVFEEQEEAAAIFYTTHSTGCLPRDIGIGLRGIVPIYRATDTGQEMTDHSEILNGFWFDKKGFSPLLIAMGASAFAFSGAQKAVVTEGFTDALLLPTLLREACEVSHLSYQLSQTSRERDLTRFPTSTSSRPASPSSQTVIKAGSITSRTVSSRVEYSMSRSCFLAVEIAGPRLRT